MVFRKYGITVCHFKNIHPLGPKGRLTLHEWVHEFIIFITFLIGHFKRNMYFCGGKPQKGRSKTIIYK